nr:MAG TPA: hypothetical protein [Bacteriophage sp.]
MVLLAALVYVYYCFSCWLLFFLSFFYNNI